MGLLNPVASPKPHHTHMEGFVLWIHTGSCYKRANLSLWTHPAAGGEEGPVPEDLGTSWAIPKVPPPSADQGLRRAVWQSRFGSVDVTLSTVGRVFAVDCLLAWIRLLPPSLASGPSWVVSSHIVRGFAPAKRAGCYKCPLNVQSQQATPPSLPSPASDLGSCR